jgi:two-component system, NarL family, response regulator EvgA
MGKRVLIADHRMVRKTVCAMFLAEGFEVSYAEDGAEAVQKVLALQPDLVVLDLAMPVMNGLEAARKLKILIPSLPLLMLTNYLGSMVEQEARAAGITAVVSKSDTAGQLLVQAKALVG